MNILGIGGYSHDSAAALVCDGQLVAGVAEERLARVKHQGGPPRLAVTSRRRGTAVIVRLPPRFLEQVVVGVG